MRKTLFPLILILTALFITIPRYSYANPYMPIQQLTSIDELPKMNGLTDSQDDNVLENNVHSSDIETTDSYNPIEERLLDDYRKSWDNLHKGQNTPFNPYESNPLLKYLSTPNQPRQEQPKEIFNASQVAEENLKKYGLTPTTARNGEDFRKAMGIVDVKVSSPNVDSNSLNRVAQLAVDAKQAEIDCLRNGGKHCRFNQPVTYREDYHGNFYIIDNQGNKIKCTPNGYKQAECSYQ